MSQKIHVCPNCGAYVMSNDNVCPRCDAPLDAPVVDLPVSIPASEDRFNHPTTGLPEAVVDALSPDTPLLEAEIESVTVTDESSPEPAPVTDETLPEARIASVSVTDETPPEVDWDPATPLIDTEIEPAAEEPLDTSTPGEPQIPAEATQPRLADDLGYANRYPAIDISEIPTGNFESVGDITAATPVRQQQPTTYTIPPAPYTPPPLAVPPPTFIAPPPTPEPRPAYGVIPGTTYFQQRVQAYKHGGYRVQVHAPHEATLTRGKSLGVFGWLLALISGIGILWYLLILAMSGFQADHAYLMLEPDGRIYEDGPGAAHIRHQRSRTGRRWSIFGLLVFVFNLILAVILGVVGWIALDRYKPALREAYPEITLFEDRFSDETANPDDVAMVEDGAVVYSILAGITIIGLWGGLTLLVIGSIHAAAYRVRVPPLPGYA